MECNCSILFAIVETDDYEADEEEEDESCSALARSSTLHRADAQTRTEVGGDEVIAVTL
jgi:hypothetical protein